MTTKVFIKALLQTSAITAVALGTAFAQDSQSEDEVVVTGSRIKKDTFTSPVSMDVLTVEEAKIEGIADIGGLLQTATAASGSSQVTSAVSTAFVTQGGTGAETVGLRGLAANRTLDLINGRRAGPSGTRGSVSSFDLNSIPLIGLEQADILKDGASAVYGSDAIAGVINYVTDKSDNKEIDLYTMIPEDGGGEIFRASGTYGETFDKGRFRITGDYIKEKELARRDRDYLDCNQNYSFTDSSLTTRADTIDPRTGNPQCAGTIWGHVWVYDYGSDNLAPNPRNIILQYDRTGNLGSFIPAPPTSLDGSGAVIPPGWFQVEYDQSHIDGLPAWAGINVGQTPNAVTDLYPEMQRNDSVNPEQERMTLMADAEYELSSNVTAYGEALFNRRKNHVNGHQQYWNYSYGATSFTNGGIYNSTPTAAGWGGPNTWFSPTPVVEHGDETVEVDYWRLVGGLRGEFGDAGPLSGWSWDAYAQHSDSHGEYTEQLVRADAIFPYNFSTSSCVGQTSPGASADTNGDGTDDVVIAGRPCVDVRWFDPGFLGGELTEAERGFLLDEDTGVTDYTQTTIEGYLTGELMKVPAGDLDIAFGLFYQRDKINDRPSDTTLAGNEFFGSRAGITTGVQSTLAGYTEVSLPIIKDKPLFQDLSVTGSARYNEITSKHQDGRSIKADGFNYRLTADWEMSDALRIRGSHGTSFRAPGLFEQFLADQSTGLRQNGNDPCIDHVAAAADGDITQQTSTNCAAAGIPGDYPGAPISGTVLTGGGFGRLEAESSTNYTVGAVFTPDIADISFAIDYFNIEIKDEIDTLSAGTILDGCYDSANFATEPLCDLILRAGDDPDFGPTDTVPNRISKVFASYINVNSQRNSGLDFTLRYNRDTKWGPLRLNAQATHQIKDEIDKLAESETEFLNGGIGEPKWTGFANFTLEPSDNWLVRYGLNYIGKGDGLKNLFETRDGVPILASDIVDGVYTVQQDEETVFWKTTAEAMIYHNLSAQYAPGNGWTLRAGVNNLFDEAPPAQSAVNTYGNTAVRSQYDLLGRRFFLNVSKSLTSHQNKLSERRVLARLFIWS